MNDNCRGELDGVGFIPDADSAINGLPINAAGLIPHGPSIRMIDRLTRASELEAEADFVVPRDGPFISDDGYLDETAYVEMIAQALAAWRTFDLKKDEEPLHMGLLLGVSDLHIAQQVRAGDQLQIHVLKVTYCGPFGVAQGTIRKQDGTVVAQGELKIWQSSASPAEMADK